VSPDDQKIALYNLIEIRKHTSLKKLRNLSLSLKERTMTALKLAEGLGLTEAGVKVLGDIGRSSEQQKWDGKLEG
jgi:hypothetical protein